MNRILIVDDEQSVVTAFQEGFKRHEKKFKTDVAYSAEEAFELIDKHPYRMVISDIRLPQKSGLDVLLKLREVRPEAVFVAMTAFSSPEVEKQVRKLGGLKYLEKPFEFEELEALVLAQMTGVGPSEGQGLLESLELSSVAQLISMECKTLVLKVAKGSKSGYLSFRKGTLVDATFGKLKGEKAAVALFSLEKPKVALAANRKPGRKSIRTSLMNLLMNAMKEVDEQAVMDLDLRGVEETEYPDTDVLTACLAAGLRELEDVKGFQSVAVLNEKGTALLESNPGGSKEGTGIESALVKLLGKMTEGLMDLSGRKVNGLMISATKGTLFCDAVSTDSLLFYIVTYMDSTGNLAMTRKAMDHLNGALNDEF